MALEKAKRSLKAYKGHLTRATNNCEEFLRQSVEDQEGLKTSIKGLENRWSAYEAAYEKVEMLLLDSTETIPHSG